MWIGCIVKCLIFAEKCKNTSFYPQLENSPLNDYHSLNAFIKVIEMDRNRMLFFIN